MVVCVSGALMALCGEPCMSFPSYLCDLAYIVHRRFLREYDGTGRNAGCEELLAYLEDRRDWELLKPLAVLTILSPLCAGLSSRSWKHMSLKGFASVRVLFLLLLLLLRDHCLIFLVDSISKVHATLRDLNM